MWLKGMVATPSGRPVEKSMSEDSYHLHPEDEDPDLWRCSCGASERQPMHTVDCERHPGTIIKDDIVTPVISEEEADRDTIRMSDIMPPELPTSCENCEGCKDIDAYRYELLHNPKFFTEETARVNRMDPFGEWLRSRDGVADVGGLVDTERGQTFTVKKEDYPEESGLLRKAIEVQKEFNEALAHEADLLMNTPVPKEWEWHDDGVLEVGPEGKVGRYFETGAYRDTDAGKNDYEGFLSPLVLLAFGDYMTEHRTQSDGELRDSDNWQKGIPRDQYIKSAFRHFVDLWLAHRGQGHLSRSDMHEALAGLFFNIQGYWHELLKEDNAPPPPRRWWEKPEETE